MRKILILALALVAVLGIASSASAKSRDRNHDRIPDKWERAHHLSLKVKQGKRDQDRDGLNNRGEFRARLNPRDADTDDDGIKDGDENAGSVKSFKDGVLTITLAKGGELSGTVTGDTEIECDSPTAHESDDGSDDHESGDDESGDDHSGPGGEDESGDDDGHHDAGDDDPGDDDQGDDDQGDDDHGDCGTDALTSGTKVREAELKATSGGAVWREVELATA